MAFLVFLVTVDALENREPLENLEEEDWKVLKDKRVAQVPQVHLESLGRKENGDHQEEQDSQEELVPLVQ